MGMATYACNPNNWVEEEQEAKAILDTDQIQSQSGLYKTISKFLQIKA